MLANLTTVQQWPKELESVGEWLQWDELGGKVSRILCALCAKHVDSPQSDQELQPAFIEGLVGSALKKDNVAKHKKFDNQPGWSTLSWIPLRSEKRSHL